MNVFHKGELAVQEKAGVATMASRVGGSIKNSIHPVAQNFLRDVPFVIAASSDENGDVWASTAHGDRGFIEVPGDTRVRIPVDSADPRLVANIGVTGRIGILAIEFKTRLRMRLNGTASIEGEWIEIEAEEVFSNCQKYIQSREEAVSAGSGGPGDVLESARLSAAQALLIEASDTFFIASYSDERGADASHRGGNPGFVRVVDESTLLIPDYSGNNMFQTLGNIEENGRAGLLFIDFANGSTLQMTGKAKILWEEKEFEGLPGANRAVRFSAKRIIETADAFPRGWEFVDYSPVNP